MAKLRLPRHILPFFAIGALGFAAYSVATTQPNRETTQPSNTPPTAPANNVAMVSGAGIVEPSSELIEVGAHRAGIITSLAVQPGQLVSRGDLLFTIDPRDAEARSASARRRWASPGSRSCRPAPSSPARTGSTRSTPTSTTRAPSPSSR
jgi:multidrug efflux pump subunit AcrA (membrane-fusion protein)